MGKLLRSFLDETGNRHPSELTEADVLAWCRGSGRLANNTVRGRISLARTFLRWCRRRELCQLDPEEEFAILRRSFPATYGKKQAAFPARWLTREEAFGPLIDACKDGTWMGSRDQLIIRFGLMGLRCAEMIALTFDAVQPDGTLNIRGKGNKVAPVHPGPTFRRLLGRWQREYERQLGRPVRRTDPILCPAVAGWGRGCLHWGAPIQTTWTIRDVLAKRSDKAGLGHLAPHHLRRSCAGILYKTQGRDGGRTFGLEDIRKVMRHSQATTTQHYLNDLDTEALDLAAPILD